jgi:hypothetical protein
MNNKYTHTHNYQLGRKGNVGCVSLRFHGNYFKFKFNKYVY